MSRHHMYMNHRKCFLFDLQKTPTILPCVAWRSQLGTTDLKYYNLDEWLSSRDSNKTCGPLRPLCEDQ